MQKKSKQRREARRRKWLKMRAPPDPRVALTMLIYHRGIETAATWKTEQHYQAMALFLKKMLGETSDRPREPEKPQFYYIETEQQWDALCDFAQRLSKMLGKDVGRISVSVSALGSQPIVLADESTSSAAANRFSLGGALTISPKQAALLRYDGTAQRWRMMSGGTGFLAASSNLSDLGSLPAARANLGVRELLTANRTYYVRTDGNNANSGLANNSAGAFLTLQRAFDVIVQTLDLGGFAVTVQVADGTYGAGVAITQPWTGGGAVTFQGNNATPANVLVSVSTDCFSATGTLPGVLTIRDIKLSTSSGAGILHSGAGVVQFSNLNFGACTSGHIMSIASGANVVCTGNYMISGNVAYHTIAAKFGVITIQSKTVTLSGTPAFSGAFALVNPNGLVMIDGCTFSGSATGIRYSAANGGTIFTAGAATTYLPGSTAGAGTNYGTTPFGLYA